MAETDLSDRKLIRSKFARTSNDFVFFTFMVKVFLGTKIMVFPQKGFEKKDLFLRVSYKSRNYKCKTGISRISDEVCLLRGKS